ncbi:hypothetical protein GGX14DRAFT_661203 [Mycena pura]|uniref:DUF4100 domain-containing protein n=1 Tax=Mycena pura TaxID=153505 RepID=A0AAD6V887_9AGAR|nr:hypothetical protein GGX14DRAFT_661203 [Mycena pura]
MFHMIMEYITDVTLVLDQLFYMALSEPFQALAKEDIDKALEKYRNPVAAVQVRSELQTYPDNVTVVQILQQDKAKGKSEVATRRSPGARSPGVCTGGAKAGATTPTRAVTRTNAGAPRSRACACAAACACPPGARAPAQEPGIEPRHAPGDEPQPLLDRRVQGRVRPWPWSRVEIAIAVRVGAGAAVSCRVSKSKAVQMKDATATEEKPSAPMYHFTTQIQHTVTVDLPALYKRLIGVNISVPISDLIGASPALLCRRERIRP